MQHVSDLVHNLFDHSLNIDSQYHDSYDGKHLFEEEHAQA